MRGGREEEGRGEAASLSVMYSTEVAVILDTSFLQEREGMESVRGEKWEKTKRMRETSIEMFGSGPSAEKVILICSSTFLWGRR